jgi:hypothetical protein
LSEYGDPRRLVWGQVFAQAAARTEAALQDVSYDLTEERQRISEGLRAAGWDDTHIERRLQAADANREPVADATSPGVGPGLEAHARKIADRVHAAIDEMGIANFGPALVGIEPVVGPKAEFVGVPFLPEGTISVSSFLFRWCGLIARAYTRTLLAYPLHWDLAPKSEKDDLSKVLQNEKLCHYWVRVFGSFAVTGTHALVPFEPATKEEVLIFEQVAWAMEYFAISHEYGHYVVGNRGLEADPFEEEFKADRFAMRVAEYIRAEPLGFDNPYIATGAGGTLLLLSLELLRTVSKAPYAMGDPATHPPTVERVDRIANRHAMQPKRLAMDRSFNDAACRIMQAVSAIVDNYQQQGYFEELRKWTEEKTAGTT